MIYNKYEGNFQKNNPFITFGALLQHPAECLKAIRTSLLRDFIP